jgi:heme/copper-type cytochrome/quinol oxidase subunit 4
MTNQELLQSLANSMRPLFDGMPPVKVKVEFDPFFVKSGAIAFWREGAGTMYVRPDYFKKVTFDEMVDVLKHELTHAWVEWKGLSTNENEGHNEAFIRKAITLGLDLSSTFSAYPKAKQIYEYLTGRPPSNRVVIPKTPPVQRRVPVKRAVPVQRVPVRTQIYKPPTPSAPVHSSEHKESNKAVVGLVLAVGVPVLAAYLFQDYFVTKQSFGRFFVIFSVITAILWFCFTYEGLDEGFWDSLSCAVFSFIVAIVLVPGITVILVTALGFAPKEIKQEVKHPVVKVRRK